MNNSLSKILLVGVILQITACGGDNKNNTNGELSGVWRLDLTNITYLIIDNGPTATIKTCTIDPPYTVDVTTEYLSFAHINLFKIISSTELEPTFVTTPGVRLRKINADSQFNSGDVSLSSSNLSSNLSATTAVCAYREPDGIYNHIAAPYEDNYLELTVGVTDKATGEFSIPSNASIEFRSGQSDGIPLSADSGSVNVLEYTDTKFKADYQFTIPDGNAYSGSVDVNL